MIQLATVMFAAIALFAIVGFVRGWTKEVIALTGVMLALFSLEQFRDVFLKRLTAGAEPAQEFYLKAGILLVITFFAYQTPARFQKGSKSKKALRQGGLQESLLGALIGGINGYLVFGSLWYYMRQLGYPLSPNIAAPYISTASYTMQGELPLDLLLVDNLLALLVVVLFLFVIVVLI